VYWKPVLFLLEERFECRLLNARHLATSRAARPMWPTRPGSPGWSSRAGYPPLVRAVTAHPGPAGPDPLPPGPIGGTVARDPAAGQGAAGRHEQALQRGVDAADQDRPADPARTGRRRGRRHRAGQHGSRAAQGPAGRAGRGTVGTVPSGASRPAYRPASHSRGLPERSDRPAGCPAGGAVRPFRRPARAVVATIPGVSLRGAQVLRAECGTDKAYGAIARAVGGR
jgi:hypothetical protein